ncbi:hypothetical protein LEP1GSC050_3858 [Leptospira broomii serovar Hurstbridge str. 5399]|uniref:Uncharacterized protein n=1 Tax=Leptospira broomii serovar Hurstbridge str. 5399 TaxID=1049789 RepID=T0F8W3_9LEPT|nr:hypothetical protein LEP1GSC050_3858 [Leptospira broomii serovar Hurstbridge str. 5399]
MNLYRFGNFFQFIGFESRVEIIVTIKIIKCEQTFKSTEQRFIRKLVVEFSLSG